MADIPRTYLTLNQVKIAQAIIGEGEPVLLLHGWGANIELLWPLANALRQRGYQTYTLDMPGFGFSQQPLQAWTIFDYANFILSYLDAHNLARVHLFGHSFGGRLGLILGAQHSERIQKMILSNSAGLRPHVSIWLQLRLGIYKAIRDNLYKLHLNTLANTLREQYNKRYGSSDFQQASGIMRETFIQIINEDLAPYAGRVKPSTLLFWGDHDEETPLWMGYELERLIPDAGLVIHQGAGHYAYLDKLAETAHIIDHFFRDGAS